jgi:hypothetical protein
MDMEKRGARVDPEQADPVGPFSTVVLKIAPPCPLSGPKLPPDPFGTTPIR